MAIFDDPSISSLSYTNSIATSSSIYSPNPLPLSLPLPTNLLTKSSPRLTTSTVTNSSIPPFNTSFISQNDSPPLSKVSNHLLPQFPLSASINHHYSNSLTSMLPPISNSSLSPQHSHHHLNPSIPSPLIPTASPLSLLSTDYPASATPPAYSSSTSSLQHQQQQQQPSQVPLSSQQQPLQSTPSPPHSLSISVLSFSPNHGSPGTRVTLTIRSKFELLLRSTSTYFTIIFARHRCDTIITRSLQDRLLFILEADVPPLDPPPSATPDTPLIVPVYLCVEDENGANLDLINVGNFQYISLSPSSSTPQYHSPISSYRTNANRLQSHASVYSRKRKLSLDPSSANQHWLSSPKRVATRDANSISHHVLKAIDTSTPHYHQSSPSSLPSPTPYPSTCLSSLYPPVPPPLDQSTSYSSATYPTRATSQPFAYSYNYTTATSTSAAPVSTSNTATTISTNPNTTTTAYTALHASSIKPTSPCSPSMLYNTATTATAATYPTSIARISQTPALPSPAVSNLALLTPAVSSLTTPTLVRTSILQPNSIHGTRGPTPQTFNPYSMYPNAKAALKIEGNLESMATDWTPREIEAKRRLVQFRRSQSGSTISTSFEPVLPEQRAPNSICISCIWWQEKSECFVTSVDTIFLLESLVSVRFTVEEKNRIRRNLEGFRPQTVSKAKAESEQFFKVIMSFPNPKPRNIEKDVKVFPWKILAHALKKIIGKYSASYSSTAALLSPGHSAAYKSVTASRYHNLLHAPPHLLTHSTELLPGSHPHYSNHSRSHEQGHYTIQTHNQSQVQGHYQPEGQFPVPTQEQAAPPAQCYPPPTYMPHSPSNVHNIHTVKVEQTLDDRSPVTAHGSGPVALGTVVDSETDTLILCEQQQRQQQNLGITHNRSQSHAQSQESSTGARPSSTDRDVAGWDTAGLSALPTSFTDERAPWNLDVYMTQVHRNAHGQAHGHEQALEHAHTNVHNLNQRHEHGHGVEPGHTTTSIFDLQDPTSSSAHEAIDMTGGDNLPRFHDTLGAANHSSPVSSRNARGNTGSHTHSHSQSLAHNSSQVRPISHAHSLSNAISLGTSTPTTGSTPTLTSPSVTGTNMTAAAGAYTYRSPAQATTQTTVSARAGVGATASSGTSDMTSEMCSMPSLFTTEAGSTSVNCVERTGA